MDSHPLVSVVMTVYNDGPFVSAAVGSILNQTFRNFELVVVDDGAVDDSVRQVEGFVDPRVRLIRQDNAGLAAALNRGITEARGRLIARQDADDQSAPERLQRQVEFLETNPEIGMVGSDAELVDESGHRIGTTRHAYANQQIQRRLIRSNQFVHGSVMFRREAAQEAGLYRPQFKYSQDYDLWLRMAEVTRLANLPDLLYSRRLRRGAIGMTHWLGRDDWGRLAAWCARERRRGRPEPPLVVDGISRKWLTDVLRRLRTSRDDTAVYHMRLAQAMLLKGDPAQSRRTVLRAIRRSPATPYAWLLLSVGLLPASSARALWLGLHTVYRFGTWKH